MAWTTVAKPDLSRTRRRRRVNLGSYGGDNSWAGSSESFNSLQQVYRGRYDRMERYKLYEWIDRDSDVARALDLIAEHCSERNDAGQYWNFNWVLDPTEEESGLVDEALSQWTRVNEWDNRLFRCIRNVLKYGDWFFFRNPATFELYSIHPKFVLGALVDRENVEVVAWIIKNFKFNLDNLEVGVDNRGYQQHLRGLNLSSGMRNTKIIPAIHITQLTLSEGRFAGASGDDDPSDRYNNRWPFGESILEQVSKTFKQRELLEDAALIHRVQRAPSRTVWYIDTGKMRADRASWVVHNFKNELNQNRVPQIIGGDQKSVDSVYNPISQLEDIYIPVSFDQRGSKVETLEGQPWNELPDLQYFTKKMMRALRVPHSWLLGSQEGGSIFNDGRVGVAYQEEIEFSRYCERIQRNIDDPFDFEFKVYLKIRDINVSPGDFDMAFNPPTNFEEFKQNARDQDSISVWSTVKDEPHISRRFALKKYMNWTDGEIAENERMVLEERYSEADTADMGLGLGGMPGGLPPPGGDFGFGGAPLGGGFGGDLGGALGGTEPGGAEGLGGMALPDLGAGVGESIMTDRKILTEAPITADDLKPAKPVIDDTVIGISPDDKLFPVGAEDPISGGYKITLSMIRKVRQTHMSRRTENEKRLKMIKKVYGTPPEQEGGFGGMGF
jgi:hypothetical protein